MIDAETLNALPDPLRSRLSSRGFDPEQLLSWAARVGEGDARNRLTGEVARVPETMLERLPADAQERAAARVRGERALVSLSGGWPVRRACRGAAAYRPTFSFRAASYCGAADRDETKTECVVEWRHDRRELPL